jgi:hypothetical protein
VEEERERLAGGGGATSGEHRAALDVPEGDEPGRGGGGGEVAEHVPEEALVAGREPVLLLRLPGQLPEHRVAQVRRPRTRPRGPPPPKRMPTERILLLLLLHLANRLSELSCAVRLVLLAGGDDGVGVGWAL